MSSQNGRLIKGSQTGTVQVGIWCNEMQQDGESRIRHFIHAPKRRRKGTDCDRPEGLHQLAAAVQKAFEDMVRAENKNAEEVAT